MKKNITITIESSKSEDLLSFEALNWPKSDREHYGTAEIDFTSKNYYLTAKHNEKLLGFIHVQIDAGVMSIEDLLVCYDHHRKGIGTKLLIAVDKLAMKKNCHVIELITGKDWNARKLYEKNGYTLLCNLPDYYVRKDFILMVKRIDKST